MRSTMTLFSASKQAGVDLELTYYGINNRFSLLTDAVKMGKVQEADLRQSAKRLFNVRMIFGEFDPPEDNPWNSVGPEGKIARSLPQFCYDPKCEIQVTKVRNTINMGQK